MAEASTTHLVHHRAVRAAHRRPLPRNSQRREGLELGVAAAFHVGLRGERQVVRQQVDLHQRVAAAGEMRRELGPRHALPLVAARHLE